MVTKLQGLQEPEFGEITAIIVSKEQKYFVLQKLNIIEFNCRMNSFRVYRSPRRNVMSFLRIRFSSFPVFVEPLRVVDPKCWRRQILHQECSRGPRTEDLLRAKRT